MKINFNVIYYFVYILYHELKFQFLIFKFERQNFWVVNDALSTA